MREKATNTYILRFTRMNVLMGARTKSSNIQGDKREARNEASPFESRHFGNVHEPEELQT